MLVCNCILLHTECRILLCPETMQACLTWLVTSHWLHSFCSRRLTSHTSSQAYQFQFSVTNLGVELTYQNFKDFLTSKSCSATRPRRHNLAPVCRCPWNLLRGHSLTWSRMSHILRSARQELKKNHWYVERRVYADVLAFFFEILDLGMFKIDFVWECVARGCALRPVQHCVSNVDLQVSFPASLALHINALDRTR